MTKNKRVIQSLFDHVDNLKTKQIRLRASQIKQTCSCLVKKKPLKIALLFFSSSRIYRSIYLPKQNKN